MAKKPFEPQEEIAIAALLRERFELDPSFTVAVEGTSELGARLCIERPKGSGGRPDRFEISITHERGGRKDSRRDLLIDAIDALLGSLVESDFAHRSLPTGEGVHFREASFTVEVAYTRVDLESAADELLTPR